MISFHTRELPLRVTWLQPWVRRLPWFLYGRIAHWARWDQDWSDVTDVLLASLYFFHADELLEEQGA